MPEFRIAAYFGVWLYLIKMIRAAHLEALLMSVGMVLVACGIEGIIWKRTPIGDGSSLERNCAVIGLGCSTHLASAKITKDLQV